MKDFQVFLTSTEISVKRVTFSYQFKEGISVKFVKNRMLWISREKFKYFDCSNAIEIMTKIFYESFLRSFLPFTENSMKGVTFSCRIKEVIWINFVKNGTIWNEPKKMK